MNKTLAYWQDILEHLGFKTNLYNTLNCELFSLNWCKGNEYIVTEVSPTEEYSNYIDSLKIGEEYTPNWNKYIVHKITIFTKEFAYPEGHWYDNKFEGNICLSSCTQYTNLNTLNIANLYKALWMSRNPIKAKTNIVKHFIEEVEALYIYYSDIFKKYELKEFENTLMPVGYEVSSSELCISFKHDKIKFYNFNLIFDLFTNRLYYIKDDNSIVYVNYIDKKDFEQLVIDFIKDNTFDLE